MPNNPVKGYGSNLLCGRRDIAGCWNCRRSEEGRLGVVGFGVQGLV